MNIQTLQNSENSLEPSMLRQTFACFPSGLTAVCARTEQGPIGLLVSSFTSVSLEPPLVSICIMKTSKRWKILKDLPRLGLSFLGEHHSQSCGQLTGPMEQSFDGLEFDCTEQNAVFLPESTAWLECSMHQEIDAGDHTIALLKVETLLASPTETPLVFHNSSFHRIAAL